MHSAPPPLSTTWALEPAPPPRQCAVLCSVARDLFKAGCGAARGGQRCLNAGVTPLVDPSTGQRLPPHVMRQLPLAPDMDPWVCAEHRDVLQQHNAWQTLQRRGAYAAGALAVTGAAGAAWNAYRTAHESDETKMITRVKNQIRTALQAKRVAALQDLLHKMQANPKYRLTPADTEMLTRAGIATPGAEADLSSENKRLLFRIEQDDKRRYIEALRRFRDQGKCYAGSDGQAWDDAKGSVTPPSCISRDDRQLLRARHSDWPWSGSDVPPTWWSRTAKQARQAYDQFMTPAPMASDPPRVLPTTPRFRTANQTHADLWNLVHALDRHVLSTQAISACYELSKSKRFIQENDDLYHAKEYPTPPDALLTPATKKANQWFFDVQSNAATTSVAYFEKHVSEKRSSIQSAFSWDSASVARVDAEWPSTLLLLFDPTFLKESEKTLIEKGWTYIVGESQTRLDDREKRKAWLVHHLNFPQASTNHLNVKQLETLKRDKEQLRAKFQEVLTHVKAERDFSNTQQMLLTAQRGSPTQIPGSDADTKSISEIPALLPLNAESHSPNVMNKVIVSVYDAHIARAQFMGDLVRAIEESIELMTEPEKELPTTDPYS